MVKIGRFYHKIASETIYYISYEAKEIRRIAKIPRYQTGITKIFGFDFIFADSASFAGQYTEIFKKQIYNFRSNNTRPYIVDCGANIGVSILYFNRLYPASEIIGFEPDYSIFNILKKNLAFAIPGNITLINKGIWNREGKINFIDEGADGGSIIEDHNTFNEEPNITEVEVTSLKKYLDKKVDFLKIDIEGAESIVIEDCGSLLKNVDRIFIEFHSQVNKIQRLHSILEILYQNDFRYFIQSTMLHSNSPFIERNTYNNLDNLLNIYAYK
jgi:FkbM family methyltransferase